MEYRTTTNVHPRLTMIIYRRQRLIIAKKITTGLNTSIGDTL